MNHSNFKLNPNAIPIMSNASDASTGPSTISAGKGFPPGLDDLGGGGQPQRPQPHRQKQRRQEKWEGCQGRVLRLHFGKLKFLLFFDGHLMNIGCKSRVLLNTAPDRTRPHQALKWHFLTAPGPRKPPGGILSPSKSHKALKGC